MRKRGISPLIASILLIGMVFVIAVLVNLFLRNFAEDQTQSIDFKTKLNEACGDKTKLEMINICKVAATDRVKITLQNKGSGNIDSTTLFLIAGDESKSTTVNTSINGFEKKTFEVEAPNYIRPGIENLVVNYIKHVSFNNESGDCDAEETKIDVPGENLLENPGFGDGNGIIVSPPESNWTIRSYGPNAQTIFDGQKVICETPGIVVSETCVIEQIVDINPNKEYNVGTKVFIEEEAAPGNFANSFRIAVRFDQNNDGAFDKVVYHLAPQVDITKVNEWQDSFVSIDPTSASYKSVDLGGGNFFDFECVETDFVNNPELCTIKKEVNFPIHSILVWYGVGSINGDRLIVHFDDAEVRESKLPICD